MKTRVLLVDDEEEFVQALAERLSIRDYDVTTSLSGEDAVEKLRHYNFDVVILDVRMPGMDGTEVLHEMKRIKPLTEVIMLTGHATVESAIDGMKQGAYDYLLKPAQFSELLEKLEGARQRKSEHEERIRKAEVMSSMRHTGEL